MNDKNRRSGVLTEQEQLIYFVSTTLGISMNNFKTIIDIKRNLGLIRD